MTIKEFTEMTWEELEEYRRKIIGEYEYRRRQSSLLNKIVNDIAKLQTNTRLSVINIPLDDREDYFLASLSEIKAGFEMLIEEEPEEF